MKILVKLNTEYTSYTDYRRVKHSIAFRLLSLLGRFQSLFYQMMHTSPGERENQFYGKVEFTIIFSFSQLFRSDRICNIVNSCKHI